MYLLVVCLISSKETLKNFNTCIVRLGEIISSLTLRVGRQIKGRGGGTGIASKSSNFHTDTTRVKQTRSSPDNQP